jgi:hypothetical protein
MEYVNRIKISSIVKSSSGVYTASCVSPSGTDIILMFDYVPELFDVKIDDIYVIMVAKINMINSDTIYAMSGRKIFLSSPIKFNENINGNTEVISCGGLLIILGDAHIATNDLLYITFDKTE